MDRYSPADRRVALEAVRRLSEGCPCSRRPWSPGHPPAMHAAHCPFRAGSAMEVCPDGSVGYALSPEGSADYGRGYQAKLRAGRRVVLGPPLDRIAPARTPRTFNCDTATGTSPPPYKIVQAASLQDPALDPAQAPPLAGFRVLRTCRLDPELEFAVPSAWPGGVA